MNMNNKPYDRKYCQEFQNSLNYDKIDRIWKSFREAGNSLQGRISKQNFKKVMIKFNIKNQKFLQRLFERFRLQKIYQNKLDKDETIDLQDYVIGLVVISLISFIDKVRYIFYLTDLDQDGCLGLQEIQSMIQRIQKIFCKQNSAAKVNSFSLLADIAHKKAQRNFKEILVLLFKNNPSLKHDEGSLITCEQFIQALSASKDLHNEEKLIPLNLSLYEVIENVATQLNIKISQENKSEFCEFRKDLVTILQKNPQSRDVIRYPGKVQIVKGGKIVQVLPNTEKVIEKKNTKAVMKGKGNYNNKNQYKELYDQKTAEQTLQSYKLKVKKMIETKQDPRLHIQFDKLVRK